MSKRNNFHTIQRSQKDDRNFSSSNLASPCQTQLKRIHMKHVSSFISLTLLYSCCHLSILSFDVWECCIKECRFYRSKYHQLLQLQHSKIAKDTNNNYQAQPKGPTITATALKTPQFQLITQRHIYIPRTTPFQSTPQPSKMAPIDCTKTCQQKNGTGKIANINE